MLRNKIGPVFNARNGSFFFGFFWLFLKNPLLSAGRMRFFKNTKKKNKKKMDQFLTLEKAKIGPVFNSTAYIYIYIWAKRGQFVILPALCIRAYGDIALKS